MKQTLESVRIRERAAVRCTKVMKRRVLEKETWKASADHLMPGRRTMKRKSWTELHVDGNFSGEREEWQHELQRHCEGLFTDPEEAKEVQQGRIEYFFKKKICTSRTREEGQRIQLIWCCQAGAKMSENKVNGPEDAVVSEMIKQLPGRS